MHPQDVASAAQLAVRMAAESGQVPAVCLHHLQEHYLDTQDPARALLFLLDAFDIMYLCSNGHSGSVRN